MVAVIFLALFAVLALSFTALSNVNVLMSRNYDTIAKAQATAESGLVYAHGLTAGYMEVATGTYNPEITDEEALSIFDEFVLYIQNTLDNQGVINFQLVDNITYFSEGGVTGRQLILPTIKPLNEKLGGFNLEIRQFQDTPHTLEVISEGQVDDIKRKVQLSYTIEKDNSLLNFALMSKSRVIITGDSTVDGDIMSTWDDPSTAAPFILSEEATVNGTLGVTVSETDWEGTEVEGTYEEILYDQPIIDSFGWEDFDTTYYEAMTSSIKPSQSSGQVTEYFPHAPESYALPADATSNKVIRKVYEGQIFDDRQISAGNDTLFRDCVFEGILYVGSTGDGQATNNVRFENCTFNGIIVTATPELFNEETCKKNVLYFTGQSTFNNTSDFQDATILAPNFNVNIGNTHNVEDGAQGELTGLVVGGVVDIRGDVQVDGTILSMGDPGWGIEGGEIGTNVGFSDENGEGSIPETSGTISISPSPDRLLPVGIRTRTLLLRNPDSYLEL